MPTYHVNQNAQPNGDHEVHEDGCGRQASPANRTSLGYHADCHAAVRQARQHYAQVNGCYYCCAPCHTG